jgi:hypothetical protein
MEGCSEGSIEGSTKEGIVWKEVKEGSGWKEAEEGSERSGWRGSGDGVASARVQRA